MQLAEQLIFVKKSLPNLKIEDEQEDEVKTFSANKEEQNINTNYEKHKTISEY